MLKLSVFPPVRGGRGPMPEFVLFDAFNDLFLHLHHQFSFGAYVFSWRWRSGGGAFDFDFTSKICPFTSVVINSVSSFFILALQRGLMISHIEEDPTQVAPLEQRPNFSVSSLMAKHRGQEKASKGEEPDHHSQLPRLSSVALEREPSFFYNQMARLGFLKFLKVKRAG